MQGADLYHCKTRSLMTRYFMSIPEAAQLVYSSGHPMGRAVRTMITLI